MARGELAAALLLACCSSARAAHAHSGAPALARVLNPDQPAEIVDRSYTFRWSDSDLPTPTGSASVAFYYSPFIPLPFPPENRPALDGRLIVRGIPEPDLSNRYTWDTSTVAPGAYFIWSLVEEPPQEIASVQIVSYSPQVLHIAHPGDVLTPSVVLLTPDTPFRFADDRYLFRYSAFDPSGTGRVRIEGTIQYDGSDFVILADDLPAAQNGSFEWDCRDYTEGNWTIRISITDACGRVMTAHARYFLNIAHPGGLPDAGPRDGRVSTPLDGRVDEGAACGLTSFDGGEPVDAGFDDGGTTPSGDAADAGTGAAERAEPGGCGCSQAGRPRVDLALLLGVLMVLGRRRVAVRARKT